MPIHEVKGEPGVFYDSETGKSFSISDLREDDRYDTVKIGGFWFWVRQIVWMILHPWTAIRYRIEGAYQDRLNEELYEDGQCPVCNKRFDPDDDDDDDDDDDPDGDIDR